MSLAKEGVSVTYQSGVVIGLVVITSLAVVGCVVLSVLGVEHQSGLCTVAGTGMGALAALAVAPPAARP
jgi:hypothetical protein